MSSVSNCHILQGWFIDNVATDPLLEAIPTEIHMFAAYQVGRKALTPLLYQVLDNYKASTKFEVFTEFSIALDAGCLNRAQFALPLSSIHSPN